MPLINIADIQIGERRRRDLGNIKALADSIADVGLLHPIVIMPDGHLVVGARRIEAYKQLGRDCIEATVAQNLDDIARALRAEKDENVCRKDFTPSEAVVMGRLLEPVEKEAAKERQGTRTDLQHSGNFPECYGRSHDAIGAAVGMSGKTYEKAKQVVEAAEEQPELFTDVITEMDRTGNVDKAFKKIKQIKQRQRAEAVAQEQHGDFSVTVEQGDMLDIVPGLGFFNLIIADPPYNVTGWEWDKLGNEYLAMVEQWVSVCKRALAPKYHLFWFCSPKYAADIEMIFRIVEMPIQSRIVWHRRNMSKGSDANYKFIDTWEMIFHIGNTELNFPPSWDDSRFDVQIHAAPQTNFDDAKMHPTQKPISLIRRLVEFGSLPGARVLDPFAGSGTTGEACLGTRNCVLVEQEESYVSVIRARLGL